MNEAISYKSPLHLWKNFSKSHTHTRKKCFRVHQKRGVWTWTDSRREHACTFTLQIPLGVWSLGKCIQGIHLHTHRPLITQWLILWGAHIRSRCVGIPITVTGYASICVSIRTERLPCETVCVCSIDQKQSRCTCSRCLLLNCNHHSSALDVW